MCFGTFEFALGRVGASRSETPGYECSLLVRGTIRRQATAGPDVPLRVAHVGGQSLDSTSEETRD